MYRPTPLRDPCCQYLVGAFRSFVGDRQSGQLFLSGLFSFCGWFSQIRQSWRLPARVTPTLSENKKSDKSGRQNRQTLCRFPFPILSVADKVGKWPTKSGVRQNCENPLILNAQRLPNRQKTIAGRIAGFTGPEKIAGKQKKCATSLQ